MKIVCLCRGIKSCIDNNALNMGFKGNSCKRTLSRALFPVGLDCAGDLNDSTLFRTPGSCTTSEQPPPRPGLLTTGTPHSPPPYMECSKADPPVGARSQTDPHTHTGASGCVAKCKAAYWSDRFSLRRCRRECQG